VKSYDLIELAGRNLRQSVLRNSLTTLGISVGVASLVAMLALGVGLQQLASRQLGKTGLFDTVIVTSHRDYRSFNDDENKNSVPAEQSRVLDEAARQEIAKLPNVIEAFPDVRFITDLHFDGKPHLTMVAGLPSSAKDNDAFDGMQGSFFSSDSAAETILQKSFADELLGISEKPGAKTPDLAAVGKQLLGKQLIMRYAERVPVAGGDAQAYSVISRERPLKIIGITDQDPDSLHGGGRGRVFIPIKFAQELHVMQPSDLRDDVRAFSKVPAYLTVTVRVKGAQQVQAVQEAIKKMGFNTFSIMDATRSLRRFFAVLDLFLGIFGSLALAVASLGIINTLFMAILERRREIGIMKAIGAGDNDVKKLFFAEAGAMGIVGGLAGVLLGWAIGHAINFGTNIYLVRQELPPEQIWAVPWWLVAGAIVFAFVVSLGSGLLPAARAARLDPVQALRYE
jgi:putative ABC transport system permease protein